MGLLNILAQTLAALVIFVIGYFALLFSAVAGVLVSTLAYKAGRLLWLRVNARTASAVPGPAQTPSL
jgi:hypothetical protein